MNDDPYTEDNVLPMAERKPVPAPAGMSDPENPASGPVRQPTGFALKLLTLGFYEAEAHRIALQRGRMQPKG